MSTSIDHYGDAVSLDSPASSTLDVEVLIRQRTPADVRISVDMPVGAWPVHGKAAGEMFLEACALLTGRPGAGGHVWVTWVPEGSLPDERGALVIEDDGTPVSSTAWTQTWLPMLEAQSRALAPSGVQVAAGSGPSGATYMIVFPRPDSRKPHPDRG